MSPPVQGSLKALGTAALTRPWLGGAALGLWIRAPPGALGDHRRYRLGAAGSVNTCWRSVSRNLVQVGSSRASRYSGWLLAGPNVRPANSSRSTTRAFWTIGSTC